MGIIPKEKIPTHLMDRLYSKTQVELHREIEHMDTEDHLGGSYLNLTSMRQIIYFINKQETDQLKLRHLKELDKCLSILDENRLERKSYGDLKNKK